MRKVIITSKNPVKVNATKEAFNNMFSKNDFEFESCSVPSEVSDQPMSSGETLLGAVNRVRNAKEKDPESDYWVGIEGGIEIADNDMQVFAWIYIESKEGIKSKGKSAIFYLPKEVMRLVQEGKELGEAGDIVFEKINSKQSNGTVGILTEDLITRTDYYIHAMTLALIPFKHEVLYK